MMRTACERCAAPFTLQSAAFACSFGCTFCAACTAELRRICPNCGGDLVPAPMPAHATEQRRPSGGVET